MAELWKTDVSDQPLGHHLIQVDTFGPELTGSEERLVSLRVKNKERGLDSVDVGSDVGREDTQDAIDVSLE